MRNKLLSHFFIIIAISIYGCSNNDINITENDSFEYTYNCFFDTSFSFVLTNNDTIQLIQDYHGYKLDYICLFTKEEKEQINDWLNEIDLMKLDTIYGDCFCEDGHYDYYKINRDNYSKLITVCNSNGPNELKQLSDKMLTFKRRLLSKAIKKTYSR